MDSHPNSITLGKVLLCAFFLLCKMGIHLPLRIAVRIKGDNQLSTGPDICIKYLKNVSYVDENESRESNKDIRISGW